MGVMQSGTGGAGRDAERFGDLVGLEPQVVTQDQERPLIGRQASEGPLELIAIGDRHQRVGNDRLRSASRGTTWIEARREAREIS